uniref:CD226 molecule n=1 Tax=Rousettus aegyptiacus TaxID=9407 RepID=A0A7J8DFC0_ROUAE|nr:CD226 molecule [Rousettus aegyptiacus]
MDYLTFLLAVLHVHKALCAETFHDTTVKLAKNMTLECVYPSGGTLTQVEWFKVNETEKESIAIFNPTYGMVIRTPYAEKVYFLNSTTDLNDMALSFHNASEADVGLYSCVLETFPQGSWEKTVQVVPSESFEGAISWNSHVVSESGKNITLSCELPTRQPAQRATWEKIQAHQIDHLTSCNLSQGRGYASRYRRRILTNCSQGATRAVLTLPHVTAWDAGLYRCSSEASTGENATFVIRLAVTDDEVFKAGQEIERIKSVTTSLLRGTQARKSPMQRNVVKNHFQTYMK